MADAKQRLVSAWLEKSQEDLAVAQLLIEQEQRLLGAGTYHCQQAAEKALKAILTSEEIPFPKTHDLEQLLALVFLKRPAPASENLTQAARELTPLATIFRYPGDMHEPSKAEAKNALNQAKSIIDFVTDQLAPLH